VTAASTLPSSWKVALSRCTLLVADVTGLDEAARTAARVPVIVVDRPGWAKAAAQLAGDVIGPYMGSGSGPLADAMASAEIAVGVSAVAMRHGWPSIVRTESAIPHEIEGVASS